MITNPLKGQVSNMDTSMIDILNTCFMVSLAFTILFFIISVVIAFVFDIKTIFSIRTGRAQAKTINEMKKANVSTGRLRVDGKTVTSKLSDEEKGKPRIPAVLPPQPEAQTYDAKTSATDVLTPEKAVEMDMTTGNIPAFPAETSVLSNTDEINDSSDVAVNVNFKVIKQIVLIHTEVTID